MLILFLAFLNAGVISVYFLHTKGSLEDIENTIDRSKDNIRDIEAQISEIKYDRQKIIELEAQYKDILDAGYLENQDRIIIQRNFDRMADVSKIINANYTATRGEVLPDDQAEEAGYALVKTDIRVSLESIDDIKIYDFLYLIDQFYPGITNMRSIRVEKVRELSRASLMEMTGSEPEPLAEGAVEFEWISLVPETDLQNTSF